MAEQPKSKKAVPRSISFADLVHEWDNVKELRRTRTPPRYLRIQVPKKDIDADASAALRAIAENSMKVEKSLEKLITENGIASQVARVTKELNRRRINEVRTRVLAATYFESLYNVLKDARGGEKLARKIGDTKGIVEAILIDQESENGPLYRFAAELLKIVSANKQINIDEEHEFPLITDRLRAQF